MQYPQQERRADEFVPMPSGRMQWALYAWAFGLPTGIAILLFWLGRLF